MRRNQKPWPKHFYMLYFTDKPYFKIGITTNLNARIYNFLFPYEDNNKLRYGKTDINFRKSIIAPLNPNGLESMLKQNFKNYRYTGDTDCNYGTEIFDKKHFDEMLYIITSHKYLTYFDATGYSKASELKSYLMSCGVSDNACRFFGNKESSPLTFDFSFTL